MIIHLLLWFTEWWWTLSRQQLTSFTFETVNLMNTSHLRRVTLSDANFLTELFSALSLTVFNNIQVSYPHGEEIERCHRLWCRLDSAIWYLLYTTLKNHTYCTINHHYSSLSSRSDGNLASLWLDEQFQISSYITFDYTEIILHPSNLILKLQQAEEVFIMKKNNWLQKTIKEEINKSHPHWEPQNEEGDNSFTMWKLFTSDQDVIQLIHKHIRQGHFTSAGFTEGRYKAFFLRRVRLADNAVRILLKADIINSTCNMCWPLNFNINDEVWRKPFTGRRAHFDLLSLNEHRKLQIFMNYSLHDDHDPSDHKILSVITLFKVTVNSTTSSEPSSVMQITPVKQSKKPVFNDLVKLNTSVKKTLIITTPKPSVFSDSPLIHSSPLISQLSSVKAEEELAQLSEEDVLSKVSELNDLQEWIKLLELKKIQLTQYADEKISLLTLVAAWLNETLLVQGQDIVSAGEFLKLLLSEPSVQADWHLFSKIINWRNDYKIIILNHWALCDQVRSAVSHFPLMKACIFTHTSAQWAKVNQWAETEDKNWVSEPDDNWRKYLIKEEDTVILSVEKELVSCKRLQQT